MKDIFVRMCIEVRENAKEDVVEQISYVLNEACSKLENLKCNASYKLKDSNYQEIHLDLP